MSIQTLKEVYATKEEVAEIRGMMKVHKAKPQITRETSETTNNERAIKGSNIKVYTMPDVNEIKKIIKTYVTKNYSIAYIKRELVDKLKKCTKPSFYRYVKQMGYS